MSSEEFKLVRRTKPKIAFHVLEDTENNCYDLIDYVHNKSYPIDFDEKGNLLFLTKNPDNENEGLWTIAEPYRPSEKEKCISSP